MEKIKTVGRKGTGAKRSRLRPASEVPEVFEMPSVPTVRVWGKVRHVGPAPFVFVDELADEFAETGKP